MVAYVVVYTLFEGYDPQYEDTPYDKPDKSFEVLGVYLSLTEANAAAKQEFVDHLNGGEEPDDEDDDDDLDRNGYECDTEDVGGGKLKYTALSLDENEKFEIEVTSTSFDDQASPSPSPSPSPPPHGKGGRKKRTKLRQVSIPLSAWARGVKKEDAEKQKLTSSSVLLPCSLPRLSSLPPPRILILRATTVTV